MMAEFSFKPETPYSIELSTDISTSSLSNKDQDKIAPATSGLISASAYGDDIPASLVNDRKNGVYTSLLTLATMVSGLSSVCIKQLLLPIQVSLIAPLDTNTSFTIVASIGALSGLLATPLIGALSDRTTLRWGRRRPWILFGIIVAVSGMLLMAGATTISTLLIGEIMAQVGVDAILSTLTALIPDQIPTSQRSFISALIGMAPNVGGVLGLVLVTRLTNPRIVSQGYVLMAAVSTLFVLAFFIVMREQPLRHEVVTPVRIGHFLWSFIHPLASLNFACVYVSRCFVYLSFTLLGAYLLFYLRTILHLSIPMAAGGVTTFQLLSTGFLFITAIITGLVAKRLQHQKLCVFGGAMVMAIGLMVVVFFPSWSALMIAAGIFGIGFGIYLGSDIALAIRVLPSGTTSGKDLGIMYTAIFLSLIVSPLLGGVTLHLSQDNFALLFFLAACSSFLGAIFILPIKLTK